MARRFSDNPAAAPLTGAEVIPGMQSGGDVKTTAQDIADLAPAPSAGDVAIADAGGYFAGGDVEAALQELGAGGGGLSNPMTTAGDIIIGGTAGAPARLAAGTAGDVLTSNGPGAAPSYQAAAGGGGAAPAHSLQAVMGSGLIQPLTDGVFTNSSSTLRRALFSQGRKAGKRYFAVKLTALGAGTSFSFGIGQQDVSGGQLGATGTLSATRGASWGVISSGGQYAAYHGSVVTYGAITVTAGHVLVCYVDLDAGKIWWSLNGTIPLSGDPTAGTGAAFSDVTGTCYPGGTCGAISTSSDAVMEFDFSSASPFGATIASGFTAWDA